MFLEDDDEGIMGLFATHPPIGKRIAALAQYAGGREPEAMPIAPPTAAPARPPFETQDPQGPWGERRDGPPGPWS
jgi:heat shock protein HtpX